MIDREKLGQIDVASQEAQDLEAIERILSREGVKDVISRFGERFHKEPGQTFLYGITRSGLVVGVREGAIDDAFRPGYFKAWALDASLPADQIEPKMIEADFSYNAVERLRDGGTTTFPGMMTRDVLHGLMGRPDEEIRAAVPNDPGMIPYVRFAEKIGGSFYYPSPFRRDHYHQLPSVGVGTLYPLK